MNNIEGNAPQFVKNMAGEAQLNIYDEIGFWGVDQNDFQQELSALNGEPLTVRISSNGGSVQDAIAMYNMLKDYDGTVTTINDSIAASAATMIYLAGDVRKASAISSFMTHKPMSSFYGNTDELVEFNAMLEHFNNIILNSYIAGGIDEETAKTLIDSGDYWFNGEAAFDMGFVNDLTDDQPVENNVDLTKFANVPDFVLNSSLKDKKPIVAQKSKPVEKTINQEVKKMADEKTVEDAKREGFAEAVKRINAVNALDSRKGREALADQLVANAALSVEDIDAALQTVPAAQAAPVLNLNDDLGDLSGDNADVEEPVNRVANFAASLGKGA
jgi:ATP-dependent protease ClpP protease subunit